MSDTAREKLQKTLTQHDFRLLATEERDNEAYDFVHRKIKSFNDAVSIHHKMARESGRQTLDYYVIDDQKQIWAGLTATTYWGWLDIDHLWVREAIRHSGFGRLLLRSAEEKALERNCKWAVVKTFSFQAVDFYQKLGYRIVGRLEDYPPGATFFWLRKELT